VPKHILIADDNVIVREVVKESLEMMPEVEDCREAANGREAVERARESKPDLIILDLAMPEMNGMQAAKVLKQSMPEVPIVLFTMYHVGSWSKDMGVDAVVSKPDGIGRLAECVQSLLAAHS
jgi:DNA-binding NarL/FixJ family response regulator